MPLSARLRSIGNRVYQDFAMASRLASYSSLLSDLIDRGYTFLTMSELAELARRTPTEWERRHVCVLRNDIDSDVATARMMFDIERRLGIRSTYYFRLSTLDPSLMRGLEENGSEVGYHYEELATYAKKYGLVQSSISDCLPDIRNDFRRNISAFATVLGHNPRTVASHGDFCNRALGLTNSIVVDEQIRRQFGIVAETYDAFLMRPVQERIADTGPPAWWTPRSPHAALATDPACLYILVHPRQWRANRRENLRLIASRVFEGTIYSFRTRTRTRTR